MAFGKDNRGSARAAMVNTDSGFGTRSYGVELQSAAAALSKAPKRLGDLFGLVDWMAKLNAMCDSRSMAQVLSERLWNERLNWGRWWVVLLLVLFEAVEEVDATALDVSAFLPASSSDVGGEGDVGLWTVEGDVMSGASTSEPSQGDACDASDFALDATDCAAAFSFLSLAARDAPVTGESATHRDKGAPSSNAANAKAAASRTRLLVS